MGETVSNAHSDPVPDWSAEDEASWQDYCDMQSEEAYERTMDYLSDMGLSWGDWSS